MSQMGDGLAFWVRAQMLLARFFGVAFGIGLAVMRMPYALPLGMIGGVLKIIPYVGGFIMIVLAVLIGVTTSKLWLVIAAILWYAFVVNLEAHVIAPNMAGEIVGPHPLVVVVALFLGAKLLGVLGALLTVPIAVLIQTPLNAFSTFDEQAGDVGLASAGQMETLPLQPGVAAGGRT